jgi:activator of 2-hydroxyglutaryl-CoA dehydratase
MALMKKEGLGAGTGRLFVGLDVGSSFVHGVVLSADGAVVYAPEPIMHFANPLGAIAEAWRDITSRFDPAAIQSTALTGSAAESFPRVMQGALYVYDSVAIPRGAEAIAPDAKYLFHIGAKDAYFFALGTAAGRKIIVEWRTGTKCGGGSGMLVEKQCRRLFQGDVPAPALEDPAAVAAEGQKGSSWPGTAPGCKDGWRRCSAGPKRRRRARRSPVNFWPAAAWSCNRT